MGEEEPAVEKRDDAGVTAPEVVEAAAPEPPNRAAPGKVRVRATAFFKDGQILSPDRVEKPWVAAGEVIEVDAGTFRQLRESMPRNWTVL